MLRGQGTGMLHAHAAASGHANRICIAGSPLFIISLVAAWFVVSTQVNSFILPIELTFLLHAHPVRCRRHHSTVVSN